MSTLGKLTKFQIAYYFKPRFESKKDRNKFIGLIVFMGVCFLMPLIMMIGAVYMGSKIAITQGVLPELLSALFLSIQLCTVVLGTLTYINTMYFSKDNTLLISMPIKSIDIYISKMVVCLISMMGISSLLAVPSMITTAVAMANNGMIPGVSFYLVGLFGLVALPLIALLVISIVVFPVMKILSFLKKRPVLMSVVSVCFAILIMFAMYGMMYSVEGADEDIMNIIIAMTTVGKYSYATLVLSRAMVGVDALANTAILIGILIGSLIISGGLSALLYKNTITRLDEGGMAHTVSKASIKTSKEHPIIADIKREVRIIIRCPDLFVQTLMMIVFPPVLIVVFMVFGNDMPTEEGMNTGLFFTAMVYFYVCITMGINYLASIGISRERDMLGMLKTLPISAKDIIKAKLLLADVVTIFIAIISTVTYALCSKDVPWYSALFMVVLASAQGMTLNAYALYRDAKKPNLKWMSVREITKNNFGAIVPMFISMAVGILLSMVAGALSFGGLSHDAMYLIFWAIATVVNIIFYFVFRYGKVNKMAVLFEAIEA